MPIFRDVDKVIVAPSESGADGCTQQFIAIIGTIALAGLVLYGC